MQTNLFKAATDANESFEHRPEDMLRAPIEIIVAGATHTGKSLISAIIEKALIDAGFTGVVLVDSEESPTQREQMAIRARTNLFPDEETLRPLSKSLLSKPITLRQANMNFVPPSE